MVLSLQLEANRQLKDLIEETQVEILAKILIKPIKMLVFWLRVCLVENTEEAAPFLFLMGKVMAAYLQTE